MSTEEKYRKVYTIVVVADDAKLSNEADSLIRNAYDKIWKINHDKVQATMNGMQVAY